MTGLQSISNGIQWNHLMQAAQSLEHNTAKHSTSPRLAQVSESTSPKHSHIPNKRSQTFAPSRLQGGARKSVGRDDSIGILQMVTC